MSALAQLRRADETGVYAPPTLTVVGGGDEAEIVEASFLVALAVVLAVFATVALWCLAVCLGRVSHCEIHWSWLPWNIKAHAVCR